MSTEHGARGGSQKAGGPEAHVGPVWDFQLVTQHPTHLVALPTEGAFLPSCQVPALGTLSHFWQPLPLEAGGWGLGAGCSGGAALLPSVLGWSLPEPSTPPPSAGFLQGLRGKRPLASLQHPLGKLSPGPALACQPSRPEASPCHCWGTPSSSLSLLSSSDMLCVSRLPAC